MQQSALLRFVLENSLPLRQVMLPGPISPAASHHPVLQNSCRVREQPLIFGAFCSGVKSYLRLINCPIHDLPLGWLNLGPTPLSMATRYLFS